METIQKNDHIFLLNILLGKKRAMDFLKYEDEILKTIQWAEWEQAYKNIIDLTDEIDQMITVLQES
jgi:hypothetical protein